MRIIFTFAAALLSATACLWAETYHVTATMIDNSKINIEFEENKEYIQNYSSEEGTGTVFLTISEKNEEDTKIVFAMPLSDMQSLSLKGVGIENIVSDKMMSYSYSDGMLNLTSNNSPTLLTIATPDGTLLLQQAVTSDTSIRMSDLGSGTRIVRYGESTFKILITKQ